MTIKLDVSLQSVNDLPAIPGIAASAEALGFGGLWAAEVNHDPFVQLALAAEHTTRLQIGTAIALSFTRSPMTLAYTAWDLAALSGGRFVLGLGTQVKAHNEKRFGVPWSAPIPRLREVIGGLRAIWHAWRTGDRLNYRGEFYRFTLMTPFFTPPPHDHPIPIYIAGVNTGLCKLAGELCDGFHVHPLHSVKYLTEVVRPAIDHGARAAGRTIDDLSLSASIFVITGQTPDQTAAMRHMVREQIAFYASTPSYRVIFDTHGWADTAQALSRLAARKRWADMPDLITDPMIETFAVVAKPEEVGPAILHRYAGLINRATLYLPYQPGQFDDLWQPTIQAFATQ